MKKVFFCCSIILLFSVGNVSANGSIQALGSWWEAGDASSSYGGGLRGSIGKELALDLTWTYFGGQSVTVDIGDRHETFEVDGLNTNAFDIGGRYTFPMEIYLGGGGSYYLLDSDVGSTDGQWGLYGLLGWSFGGDHFRGFIEGIYRYTEATVEVDTHLDRTEDVDLSYDGFGANIGIMYRF